MAGGRAGRQRCAVLPVARSSRRGRLVTGSPDRRPGAPPVAGDDGRSAALVHVKDERERRRCSRRSGTLRLTAGPPLHSRARGAALSTRRLLSGGRLRGGSRWSCCETVKFGETARIRADVETLIVETGRGVRLRDGEELRARRVVSKIGAGDGGTAVAGGRAAGAVAQSIAGLSQSPAHVCLYLGFAATSVRASRQPLVLRPWNGGDQAWHPDRGEQAPVLCNCFPSLKRSLHCTPQARVEPLLSAEVGERVRVPSILCHRAAAGAAMPA